MKQIAKWLQGITGFEAIYSKILLTVILLIILWIIRAIVLRALLYRTEKLALRYLWRQLTKYLTWIFYFIFIWDLWISKPDDLITFLGLVSAGLAIAFKDPIINFGGWLYILSQKLFMIGDRIQMGEHRGDVIGISTFETTLMEVSNPSHGEQSTGRIVHFPNGMVFSKPLINYTKGFNYIWNEVDVDITLESNWQKAMGLLIPMVNRGAGEIEKDAEEGLKDLSMRYVIHYKNLRPTVYLTRADHGIRLTLRYLCQPRKRRDTEHYYWMEILKAFGAEPDIELAYPTRRAFNHRLEGKIALRPEAEGDPKGESKDGPLISSILHLPPFFSSPALKAKAKKKKGEDE